MTDRELLEQILKEQRDIRQTVADVRQTMATKDDIQRVERRLGGVEGRLDTLEQFGAQIKTGIEALAAGQEEQATKQDIQNLDAKVMKKIKSHERRINTLEDELDIPHPEQH